MENPTAIILSRMLQASRTMDVVANNIANASTPGYKSLHLSSGAWIDRMRAVNAPDGGGTVAYATPTGTWRDTRPGPIHQTGNPLDFALPKSGYFTVQTSAGTRLTRDGRFTLSSSGNLVTSSGDNVLDASGQAIQIPQTAGKIAVASDGTISGPTGILGKIGVVNVANQQSLTAEGDNLLRATTTPSAVSNPGIIQGALEGSNVQPIKEITNMLQASQNFQMISQFVSSEDSRHQNAVDKIVSST
jgi:flagellar basal-body rod protein FlgF